jgi:hypothetical protein
MLNQLNQEALNQMTNEQLAELLVVSKKEETDAANARKNIEELIISRFGHRPEGSQTHELANGLKVVITGKMTYSSDIDKLIELSKNLPEMLRPLKVETKLDETGAKYLRNNEPEAWKVISDAITIKPAKTSVSIKA